MICKNGGEGDSPAVKKIKIESEILETTITPCNVNRSADTNNILETLPKDSNMPETGITPSNVNRSVYANNILETSPKDTNMPETEITSSNVNRSVDTNKILETSPKDTDMPEIEITSSNLLKTTKSTTKAIKLTGYKIKECKRICCSGKVVPRGQPVKSIDECHPNDIGLHFNTFSTYSDSKKYELLQNIWKPPPGYIFPQHVESGRHWRVNSTYLCEISKQYYSWLCYSEYFDGVFCLPCVVFAHQYGNSNLKKLFKEPFIRWNGAPSRWSDHNYSEIHNYSSTAMQTFFGQMEGNKKRIEEIVALSMHKRITENRKIIIPIMKTVVLCGRQNISFRGHRDKTINSGNLQALLDFRVDTGDEDLRQHIEAAPKNATYQLKMIQNEIIESCGKLLQEKLIVEIKRALFFSIITDKATDSTNDEQLALVIRFVDEYGQIREEFLEIIQIHSCQGNNMAEQLKSAIQKYGLDMNFVRGQSYDRAGYMSGTFPKALYFHSTSLVVAGTCKILSVINMMDCMRKCSEIFEFSSKKQGLLEKHINSEMPKERREKLLTVCQTTRWILRLDGLERVQEMIKPILLALEDIKDNHDGSYHADARTDAGGVYHTILSFDFLINLIIVRNIFAYITPITTELQKVNLDILGVYDAVDNVLNTLQYCRVDVDRKHDKWLNDAVDIASQLNIPVKKPIVVSRQVHRENYSADTFSDYYKFRLTIPLLEIIIGELQSRFSPSHRLHSNAFFLLPSKVISTIEWKKRVHSFAEKYADDLPNILKLESELDLWECYWRSEANAKRDIPDNITDTLTRLACKNRKTWYTNIYMILVLLGVAPGSSCSCEKSISKQRLLETYLRSTMGEERLNGLVLLYTHSDIEIDYNVLLNIFERDYHHRLQILDMFSAT